VNLTPELELYRDVRYRGVVLCNNEDTADKAVRAGYSVTFDGSLFIIGGRPHAWRICDAALKLTSTK